jgi:hypothetical protein
MRRIKKSYSAESIIPVRWPPLVRLASGAWQRVWHVIFCNKSVDSATLRDASVLLSKEQFSVAVVSTGPGAVSVTVQTEEDGASDEIFLANYRMLARLEEIVGEIELIEGQPRNQWRPWHRFLRR